MVNDFLLSLGALSLGGSVAVVLFALASRTSRTRYGARWRCWVWGLLCLRMAIPFSLLPPDEAERQTPIQLELPSDAILYEYKLPQPGAPLPPDGTASPPEPTTQPSASIPVQSGQTEPQTNEMPPREFTISLSEIAAMIWLAGVVVTTAWVFVSHLRFLCYLHRWERPVRNSEVIWLYNQMGNQLKLDHRPALRTCAGLRAPMLAGLFHPKILLPEEMPDWDTLRYALLHELTHFKRRDIWLKTLALLANTVHWFNPFMWYMVRLVERDTELACDEAALRQLPSKEHTAYGRTILDTVERAKLKCGCYE